MKVEIVSCSYTNYWYSNKIGEVFEVENPAVYQTFYRVVGNDFCIIKKEDCREVFEVEAYDGNIYEVVDFGKYSTHYKIAGEDRFIIKYASKIIKQEKDMKKEFTKSDLKNFMRVKYRNGWVRMYIEGRLYSTENLLVLGDIGNYNEYLVSRDTQSLDIVEVYEEPSNKHLNSNYLGNLIWERKEKSQQEIELEKLQEQIKELEAQAEKLKEALK